MQQRGFCLEKGKKIPIHIRAFEKGFVFVGRSFPLEKGGCYWRMWLCSTWWLFLRVNIEHSKTMEILASLVMKFSDPASLGALWFSLKLLCVLLKQICREKHWIYFYFYLFLIFCCYFFGDEQLPVTGHFLMDAHCWPHSSKRTFMSIRKHCSTLSPRHLCGTTINNHLKANHLLDGSHRNIHLIVPAAFAQWIPLSGSRPHAHLP